MSGLQCYYKAAVASALTTKEGQDLDNSLIYNLLGHNKDELITQMGELLRCLSYKDAQGVLFNLLDYAKINSKYTEMEQVSISYIAERISPMLIGLNRSQYEQVKCILDEVFEKCARLT